ncbi:hypothetical protein [Rhodanobacter ginsengiterrae]|uniref:hypothetical protein n=1 Tax=Rhodanobacter ginsengiterrae TaxID=2008451 RepID=UPI003CF05893
MGDEALSYALIEKKIERYVREIADEKPGRLERCATLMALGLLAVACVAAPFVKTVAALRFLQADLALCLISMLIGFGYFVRREWHTFHRRNDKVSQELDHDYEQWRLIVAELRCFPRPQLARRLRYLSARKSSLAYRMGLFTGSVQRLGVLPLLAILYLQFKDWRFGDWQAFGQVHMVGGLLLWALFLAYLISWWLVGLGTRWDAYEALLIEAIHDE